MSSTPRWQILVSLAAAVIVVAGLKSGAGFFIPVLLGSLIAAASSPLLTWLLRRSLPPILAATLVLLVDVVVLSLTGSIVFLAGRELQERLPMYMKRFEMIAAGASGILKSHGLALSGRNLFQLDHLAGSVAAAFADVTANMVVVLFVVFFGLCEVTVMGNKVRALAPNADAHLGRLDRIVREVQVYLLVKTGMGLMVGICAFFVLKAFGIDLALLLALSLFLLYFIPNIGAAIALVPAALVALADRGPGVAAGVIACYLTFNTLIGNVLEPRLLGRTLGMSPFVVLLAMLFWGWLWGPMGALLSVPLMVVAKIVLQNIPDLAWIAKLLESDPDFSHAPSRRKSRRQSIVIGLGSAHTKAQGTPSTKAP